MDKAPEAFRTISEVADLLETPAHVLRFWESRFPQIKPVKRAGGRRYYRPADVALLSGIRHLLHAEGMTIRGVQKVLRDQGVRHVAGLSGDISDLDMDAEDSFDGEVVPDAPPAATPPASALILSMGAKPRRMTEGENTKVEPLFRHDAGGPPDRTPNAAPDHITPDHLTPDHITPDAAPSAQPPAPSAKAPAAKTPEPANTPEAANTPEPAKMPEPALPRDGEGGFIAFSSATTARGKTAPPNPPAQATLPLDDDVSEAPHVWVDADTPGADVTPHPATLPIDANAATTTLSPTTQTLPPAAADPAPPAQGDPVLTGSDLTGANLTGLDLSGTLPPQHDAPAADPPTPNLAGLAHRLRALRNPLATEAGPALAELHSRLGLLHAQMAEALRLRR